MGNTKILLNKIFLKIKDTLVNRGAVFPMYIYRCKLTIKSSWLEIEIVIRVLCNLSKHIVGFIL